MKPQRRVGLTPSLSSVSSRSRPTLPDILHRRLLTGHPCSPLHGSALPALPRDPRRSSHTQRAAGRAGRGQQDTAGTARQCQSIQSASGFQSERDISAATAARINEKMLVSSRKILETNRAHVPVRKKSSFSSPWHQAGTPSTSPGCSKPPPAWHEKIQTVNYRIYFRRENHNQQIQES